MSFRVRRSFKLAPGVKINVSKGGLSTSFGGRGGSLNIGRRGVSTNVGIPGSGLSERNYILTAGNSTRGSYSYQQVNFSIQDDGELVFLGSDGSPLPDNQVATVKRQNGPAIRQLIEQRCAEINSYVEALGTIYYFTPTPDSKPVFTPTTFPEPEPAPLKPMRIGLFGKLFKSVRAKTEARYARWQADYESALASWQERLKKHNEVEAARRDFIESRIYTDPVAMQSFMEETLQGIEWPRETSVSMEILEDGHLLCLEVDLPELEDLPRKTATVPQRGYKLTVKEISESNLRKLYANHVHGIGFRLIGEGFASLPNVQEIVLSAFAQRPDSSTGRIEDQYLYSVKVKREDWRKIDFSNLQVVDVSEALSVFEMRRSMTKTGVFKPIEPLKPIPSGDEVLREDPESRM